MDSLWTVAATNGVLADIVFSLQNSNLAGRLIVAVLLVGSVFTWSVMLTKFRELQVARRSSDRFLHAYHSEAHPAALYLKRRKFDGSPLNAVYARTVAALGVALEARGVDPGDLFMGGVGTSRERIGETHISALRNTAERAVADQALLLENNMGFLATATSTAPFLGLLGTVWGVMDAFAGMAVTGTAMLSAVAPGISSALLTTVVGLLVALPSAIGYNTLSNQIRRFSVQMDNFSQELISDFERNYL